MKKTVTKTPVEFSKLTCVSQNDDLMDGAVTKLAQGAGTTFAGSVANRGLFALTQIVLARFLGPYAFGIYSIGLTVMRLLSSVALAGLNTGVLRYASVYREKDRARLKGTVFQSVGFSLLIGFILGGALYVCTPWLTNSIFKKPELAGVLKVFSLGIPLVAAMKVLASATRASQRMKYAVYSNDFLRPTVNLILTIGFFLVGWHLLGAVAAGVISFLIGFLFTLYYVRLLFPETADVHVKPIFETKKLITFSLPLVIVSFFGMLVMWTDTLMLGYFQSASDVGIYRAAVQIAMLFTIISWTFNAIFGPMIAELYHTGDFERVHGLFKVSTKWAFYLGLPAFLVIVFTASQTLEVIFGVVYTSVASPLIILASAQLVHVMTGLVGYVFIMSDRQKIWFFNTACIAVMNILLNWFLIPPLGIIGAALATGFSIVSFFILGVIQAKFVLNIFAYDRRYLKGIGATLLTAILMFVISPHITKALKPLPALLVQMVIIYGGFITVLIALGFDREDKIIWQVFRTHLARGERA